ncbi:MAG TPA: hypothetical protein VOA64_07890 [Candidatus Dormibacteraeota bacterium]|nr:hypothetical protein [Candidatus Dormibacteraeota bacterium]
MQTIKQSRVNLNLTILFLQDHEYWVAQCLEYDVTAQGKSIEEAKLAFERTFVGQVLLDASQGKEPLAGIGQAPREYFEQFKKAQRLAEPMLFYVPQASPNIFVNAKAEDLAVYA